MAATYNLHNAEQVIDLARDIQVRVYWGGSFNLISRHRHNEEYSSEFKWRDLWDAIVYEIDEHQATAVIIDEEAGEVRFKYLGDDE